MTLRVFLSIVELRTKLVGVSTFVLALLSALESGVFVRPAEAVLLFAAVLSLDMGTTAFNTYFDYRRGADDAGRNREADKVLVHEAVPPAWALLVGLGLFAAAGLLGLVLAWLTGWTLLFLGLACFAVAFLYSGGPWPISSTPLGELFAGGFLGCALWLVCLLAFSGDAAAFDWGRQALRSLPLSLAIAGILAVNNACDRLGDADAGRRTVAVLAGARAAASLAFALPAAAYLSLAALAGTGILPRSFLWTAPLGALASLPVWLGLARRGFSHETKGPSMGGVSRAFLIFSLAAAAAWGASLLGL